MLPPRCHFSSMTAVPRGHFDVHRDLVPVGVMLFDAPAKPPMPKLWNSRGPDELGRETRGAGHEVHQRQHHIVESELAHLAPALC